MPHNQTAQATPKCEGAIKGTIDGLVWKIAHVDLEVCGLGDHSIFGDPSLGLICSVQCPGSIVIKTFDAIRELRNAGIIIAGGFHSPMEMECLDFLLRGQQPVIVVVAKGLSRPRLSKPWRQAVNASRMLVLSPFASDVRRTTKATSQIRNEFVASFTTAILIPHASPGGKAEAIARAVLERGKPLFTFDDVENQGLLQSGAKRFVIAEAMNTIQGDLSSNNM